jgi:purine-nucleoside phosphorylase
MTAIDVFQAQVEAATAVVRTRLTVRPSTALILGTGLGGVADQMQVQGTLPYGEIPHHPVSTVEGHAGRLLWGTWAGQPLLVLQGRFHLYEGYSARDISFPIRVLAALGVRRMIITNAAGGLNPQFRPADVMLITDHINLLGQNPLTGPNVDAWGPRFPEMTEPYSRRLQKVATDTAFAMQFPLQRGVYVAVPGPSLETAAETRFLRQIGADAVGMSTVPEVITAVHAGMQVLAFSVITNVNRPDNYEPAPLETILANAAKAGPNLMRLIEGLLPRLP